MVRNILLVALGGAFGSVARYLLSAVLQAATQHGFPWGTMAVNILGCLVIGFITAAAAAHGIMSVELKLLLTTGFCGGFTTFSTFMNETLGLANTGEPLVALLYVVVSVALGFISAAVGMQLGRFC